MTERDCYRLLNPIGETSLIEVKFTRGKSIPRNAVKPHQIATLKQNHHLIRQPDYRLGVKCFGADFVEVKDAVGYVCAVYHVPRKSLIAYFINIDIWDSLTRWTEEQAKEKAKYIQRLALGKG